MFKLQSILRIFIANVVYFLGGGRSSSVRTLRKLRVLLAICRIPYALIRSVFLLPKPLVFRQITFVITTKCTLKCAKCANLMHYYNNDASLPAYTISASRCISTFDTLLSAVDYVYELNVIGGEPLLHEELDIILKHFVKHPKIGKIVLTTNGTISPGDTLAVILKNPKILVTVSDYGKHSKNIDKLLSWLDLHEIEYMHMKIPYWHDNGDVVSQRRSFNALKKIFLFCRIPECATFLNGKLHHCTRSAQGMDIGMIPDRPADYVDVIKLASGEVRREIRKFRMMTSTITACDYCNNARGIPMVKIPPGVQCSSDKVRISD